MQAELIFESEEVTKLGVEVFGGVERFRIWMETENFALGNVKPKDLLRESSAKEKVVKELTLINHGIFQ